jgi:GNAT superfamily N-acetyltransferase
VTRYGRIEPIGSSHVTASFDCGSEDHSTWLRQHALQSHRSDTAKVYVVCRRATNDVVGYYALSAGSVVSEDAPERLRQGTGRYPVPVVVLARLGVDVSEQGRGLGSALVKDCFLQVASVADRVGIRALLIHAENAKAAAFYFRIDPAFEPSPTDPLHVLLLLKDLRRAIRDAAAESQAGQLS